MRVLDTPKLALFFFKKFCRILPLCKNLIKGERMVFVKFFHILFVWLWTASLLGMTHVLWRYSKQASAAGKSFLQVCRRIYFGIELPCMCLGIPLGIILLIMKGGGALKDGWFHMKLLFAIFLIVCDLCAGRSLKTLFYQTQKRGSARYLILHLATVICLVGVLSSIYIVKKFY